MSVRAVFAERADTSHAALNEKSRKEKLVKKHYGRWKRNPRKQKRFYANKHPRGQFKKPRSGGRIYPDIPVFDPLRKATYDPVRALTSGRPFRVKPGGRPEVYEMNSIYPEYNQHYWERMHLGVRTPEYLGMNQTLPGFHGLRDAPSHY